MRFTTSVIILLLIALFSNCNNPSNTDKTVSGTNVPPPAKTKQKEKEKVEVAPIASANISYTLLSNKDSIKKLAKNYSAEQFRILCAVNRTDAAHIIGFTKVLIPSDLSKNLNQYSPFPQSLPFLKGVKKIIFFSYYAEYFAAYQNGDLILSSATNMGRKKDPTPTGIFNTNWKAKETTSTVNDEWDLKWNFNILNKDGVGFHQYSLPGYPASHSCLRLSEEDAKYLYTWAEQWKLKNNNTILAKGTPVVVFGAYPFGKKQPWMQLAKDPHALDISTATLQQLLAGKLDGIIADQQKRDTQVENTPKTDTAK